MKILHLWRGDSPNVAGGGAGSMYRVHTNLRKKGIDSSILCEFKTTLDPNVHIMKRISKTEKILRKATSAIGLNDIHRISSFHLRKNEHVRNADILHFHGTHGGFFNYLALPSISRDKPCFFTLRDMWALTGHCAYSYDCDKWKHGCGNCPYPENHPKIKRDNTSIEWKLKKRAFKNANIEIVAISKWMYEQAKSSLLSQKKITYIKQSVNTHIMAPLQKEACKKALNIPLNRKVLLFSATDLISPNKGGDILINALKNLPRSLQKETSLLLMGNRGGHNLNLSHIEFIDLGFVFSTHLKALAFSAADLFVFPSRAESFGLVVLESMACGTPVIAQKVGPLPELVRPGISGLLSEPENPKDFANCIVQLIDDDKIREKMSTNCRNIVIKEYSSEMETMNHIKLYTKFIQNQTSH